MEVFLDESGSFRPSLPEDTGLASVMAVIVPENQSHSMEGDFRRFLIDLPSDAFANGEAKGSRLSPGHVKQLASMLNRHRGIMLAPVTVNTALIKPSFFEVFPQRLRMVLEQEGQKCLHNKSRSEIAELAKRCANLSPEQLVRLITYTKAILRSIEGVSLFYHCKKYHPYYSPFKVVLDRAGPPNGREELVFKQILFTWMISMTKRTPIKGVKRIHNDSHPFVQLYRAKLDGADMLDVLKMLRGNIEFANSREIWQLQLADMTTAAWAKSLLDRRNDDGYLPAFSLLHRNTVLPQDQPMGMISVDEAYSQMEAPAEFEIFRKLAELGGKLLPCGWDEE
jgi:hypothetical protein